MCLKFSEVLFDCVGHTGVGDTSHGSDTCSPSALSPESPAPLWLWEVLQRCPWNTQREVCRQEFWCYSCLRYLGKKFCLWAQCPVQHSLPSLQFRELSCNTSSPPPFLQPYLPCRQTFPFAFLELF